MEVKIDYVIGWGYFIYIDRENAIDDVTAKIIRMDLKDYHKYLKRNFGAVFHAGDSYFASEKEAICAKEWVESILLYKSMTGE